MSSDRTRQSIELAVAALKSGKNSEALNLLDQALELAPDDADLYSLRGIAFAQVGRAEPASESFRKATMLDPSAKSFYNYAVHLYNIGEKAEALSTVEECLTLDPNHADAKLLLEKIAGKGGEPTFSAKGEVIDPNNLARKRRYGFGRKHLWGALAENQEPWVALGWTVVGLSVASVLLVKFDFPLQPAVKPDPKDPFFGYRPIHTPLAFVTIGFFISTILASMIWTSVDLIDRRGRALWMVPMMICCFLFLPCLPQALYMFTGRRD